MNDAPIGGLLVMIVEDELLIATSMEIALDMHGYRILGPAATVAEAEALLDGQRPDIALIDYRLATTTTEALLPRLDAERIPVCVLSGYSRDQLPDAYAVHALLEKPFSMQKLLSVLKSLENH